MMLAKSEVEAILDRSSNQRLATIEEKARLFQKLQQLCPTSKEIAEILHYCTEVEILLIMLTLINIVCNIRYTRMAIV